MNTNEMCKGITQNEMDSFWAKIEKLNYVVLRNYNDIVVNINNGGDIDILTDNKELFLLSTGAIPLQKKNKNYNYAVKMGKYKVPIDLRIIGDGYYDSCWEKNILSSKVLFGKFYIPNEENFFYSILYHCVMHKSSVPVKYYKFIKRNGIINKRQIVFVLERYMMNNEYRYTIPDDEGVYFNKSLFLIRRISNFGRI